MSRSLSSDKPKLKIEEIAKREKIMKSVMDQKRTGKIDIKATFDLIHLSVYPLLAKPRNSRRRHEGTQENT